MKVKLCLSLMLLFSWQSLLVAQSNCIDIYQQDCSELTQADCANEECDEVSGCNDGYETLGNTIPKSTGGTEYDRAEQEDPLTTPPVRCSFFHSCTCNYDAEEDYGYCEGDPVGPIGLYEDFNGEYGVDCCPEEEP
jgi:hypothetical protein